MRTYPCSVTGLSYEGRAAYVRKHVDVGDELRIVREPDNPHDPQAVAVYHGKRKIGYIPAKKSWVSRSLDEGDEHLVMVTDFDEDDDELLGIDIEITITKDVDTRKQPAAKQPKPSSEPLRASRDVKPKEPRRGLISRVIGSIFGK